MSWRATQSKVSQHPVKLRDKDMSALRRDANRIYYRITDDRTLHLIEMMRDVFAQNNDD